MTSTPHSRADQRLLLAGIGAGVLGLIGLAILTRAIGEELRTVSAVGRPLLFAAVGALAFTGRRWATFVLVIWAACLAFLHAVAATNLLRSGHAGDAALFLGLGLVFLAASLLVHRARRDARRDAQHDAKQDAQHEVRPADA